jgi:hypothetical protein
MKNMKKIHLIIAVFFAANSVNSQVIYTEEFNNDLAGMAGAWTVTDVDGATNHANVATQFGATSSWIVDPNFDDATDSVAMSTSWMDPVTATNDWLMSPAIMLTTNNTISWNEKAQDPGFSDGYNLFICTAIAGANPAPSDFTGAAGAQIYTTAGATNPWSNQSVDLGALGYTAQNAWFAWQNNSTDMFVLMIDSIVVETPVPFDVSMAAANTDEYTLTPLPQVTTNIGTDGIITNLGGSAVTNAVMTVNVYDGSFANVYTATSTPVASIAAGANAAVNVPGYLPTAADNYIVEMISSMTEVDADATNDTAYYAFTVTDSVYARDDGNMSIALGVGVGTYAEIGQSFTLNSSDTLTSVSAFINGNINNFGKPFYCKIYDTSNDTIGALISTTDTIILDSIPFLYTLPVSNGSLILTDNFAVVAIEGTALANLALGCTNAIFTQNTGWGNTGGGFFTIESLGFNVSFMLRANFGTITTIITDVKPIESSEKMNIFPNPSNGVFTLSLNTVTSTDLTVEIFDITGKVVMTKILNNLSNSLNLTMDMNIEAGTYFAKVSGEYFTKTQKFVILK